MARPSALSVGELLIRDTRSEAMQLGVTAVSRPGARPANEDACGFISRDGVCFCVVADGAGGHRGGATASKIVVSRVLTWLRDNPSCEPQALRHAILAANHAVLVEQRRDAQLADMRSTVIALAVDTQRALAVWGYMGDSRLYLFRGGALLERTRDHSLAQQLIDTGYVSAEDLRGSFQRARLYAALGDADLPPPSVIDAPLAVREGDSFLLCTDGWWDSLEAGAIEHALAQASSADDWLRAMERQIIDRRRPGQDNYTALAVWCGAGDGG
jgi:serine/threonine protein phosphatase PrpC